MSNTKLKYAHRNKCGGRRAYLPNPRRRDGGIVENPGEIFFVVTVVFVAHDVSNAFT